MANILPTVCSRSEAHAPGSTPSEHIFIELIHLGDGKVQISPQRKPRRARRRVQSAGPFHKWGHRWRTGGAAASDFPADGIFDSRRSRTHHNTSQDRLIFGSAGANLPVYCMSGVGGSQRESAGGSLVLRLDWRGISAPPPPPLIEFRVVIVSLLLNARRPVELEEEPVPARGGLHGGVAQTRPTCCRGKGKAALTFSFVWQFKAERTFVFQR